MLIVLGFISIIILIGGAIMIHRADDYDEPFGIGSILTTVVGVIATLSVIVTTLCNISSLVEISTIDERIAMYEEQNAKIEEQIEVAVKQYQEYESGIITEIGGKSSYITLVSLYPELKADALVSKQIEVYLANNQTISDLKIQKLNERVYRWWIYFGS